MFSHGEGLISIFPSFCVAPTTPEQDADPENKLPRITFTVSSRENPSHLLRNYCEYVLQQLSQVQRQPGASPITLFLFDDEKNSWSSPPHLSECLRTACLFPLLTSEASTNIRMFVAHQSECPRLQACLLGDDNAEPLLRGNGGEGRSRRGICSEIAVLVLFPSLSFIAYRIEAL